MGADSSFRRKSHVYTDEGELPAGTIHVEASGKMFMTNRQFFQQACEFIEQMVEWARPGDKGQKPLSVSLYGDGLMQAMYAEKLASGDYQQYLREAMGR